MNRVDTQNCDFEYQFYADLDLYLTEEQNLKDEYKVKLTGLLDTRKVWEWLDENDSWAPKGIFSVKISWKGNGYYNKIMAHADVITQGFTDYKNMHRQQEAKSEIGVNHIFIRQFSCCEDSYNGYMAIPLSDYRYFLITYSC